jgi:hypothetical protein
MATDDLTTSPGEQEAPGKPQNEKYGIGIGPATEAAGGE